jgi:quercetin dioxygenase-like cupin family protein
MKNLLLIIPFFLAVASAAEPPAAVATPLMLKELTDIPGKEALMLHVVYPPGSRDQAHRHDAHAFIYVLEGSIVMQLKGSEPVTVKAGQVFYEGPDDVHLIGRNASATQPASFVVVLIKKRGAEVVLPAD